MWLKYAKYHSAQDDQIILSVPSTFYKDQIKQRYLDILIEKLSSFTGEKISIDFIIEKTKKTTSTYNTHQKTIKSTSDQYKEYAKRAGINIRYTFKNFVLGDNNRFAANASISISRNPGKTYNPCLIYGGVGLGKTHLLHAVGGEIIKCFPSMKVVYVTAENFTNEFISLIKENRVHHFKEKYRKTDALLIDDIHFLQKKKETQEELFHTFNVLFENKKQMVFTCDRPVTEIKDITERLQNRFTRGLTVDLQPPSTETAIAILRKKMVEYEARVSDEVLNLICQKITTNVRDIEAALIKIIAYTNLVNEKITIDLAKEILKDRFTRVNKKQILIQDIQIAVASYFNISTSDLKGKRKNRSVVLPRQIAMYIARELTDASMTDIGLEFGGRDHTTVIHACQRVENQKISDPSIETSIENLKIIIKEEK
ncbi:hypothetical protein LSH36_583g01215 [Paralvinella palmiformis]|uniref:Chromosomal replication initiator protein DnaA n=1 Tax=Paralvinella palmiformis TaxID=53620 RepID=A0AAD9J6Y3_9ANNE|nr:hypothetical protein LSH36_583g01215 [Paralvinella palmiformis]